MLNDITSSLNPANDDLLHQSETSPCSKHKRIVLRGKNKEVARHEDMSKTLTERLDDMEEKLDDLKGNLDDLKGKWYLIYRRQFIYEVTFLFPWRLLL